MELHMRTKIFYCKCQQTNLFVHLVNQWKKQPLHKTIIINNYKVKPEINLINKF